MNIDVMSISGHKIYGPKVCAPFLRSESCVVALTPTHFRVSAPSIYGVGLASEWKLR